MCGITGFIDLNGDNRVDQDVLVRMTSRLVHRGPDDFGYFADDRVGLGFRRLSIIDLEGGNQPLYNEDCSLVMVCNGEIFNYLELRERLTARGHIFRTQSDVEVLLHLYEDHGTDFLNSINGQFAFAIYDSRKRELFLARDHFGVNPLYYTIVRGLFIFASEIKAILEHPLVRREVDLTGLDQALCLPGLVSPRTIFKGICSLKSGHQIVVKNSGMSVREYWDLDYPRADDAPSGKTEKYYIEELSGLLERSVRYRLQADVPVGLYVSGGLDSSMIAVLAARLFPGAPRHSFSIGFVDKEISESKHQRLIADFINSQHHEMIFGWPEISEGLRKMIYHCECPVKETYNTCSMSLSKCAKSNGVKAVLTGEGADELFAGYVGYRFDQFGPRNSSWGQLETVLEEQTRERLWGDPTLFYEMDYQSLCEVRAALYSASVNELLEDFDFMNFELVNKERLKGRHYIHQRSYLDFKLRLSDHLISDHGDRMALASSVEARYPFLDIDLIEFSRGIPPALKLNEFTEKYILRRVAEGLVPPEILKREKYGFHAPGSPYLLKQDIDWINEMLSYGRIEKEGYFNPNTVQLLKKQYTENGYRLNLPFETDLLMIVLSFGAVLELFGLPSLN